MKKSLFAVLILLLCTTTAFAASFAPTLLKLSVASPVQYEFDGTTLSINPHHHRTPGAVSIGRPDIQEQAVFILRFASHQFRDDFSAGESVLRSNRSELFG